MAGAAKDGLDFRKAFEAVDEDLKKIDEKRD
jgi:hypothetical protein